MKLHEFPLLADQNIHFAVVEHLRRKGFAVSTVAELGLEGATTLS